MVDGLPSIEGKQALGVRTLNRNVGGVECLEEEESSRRDDEGFFTYSDAVWVKNNIIEQFLAKICAIQTENQMYICICLIWLKSYLGVTGLSCKLTLRVVEHLVHLFI